MWAVGPLAHIVTFPIVTETPDKNVQCFPGVFITGTVTWAVGRQNLILSRIAPSIRPSVSIPDTLLAVSCTDLVEEQRDDPMLSELFDCVLTNVDAKSAAKDYLLQDQLLVRKWVPCGEHFVGEPV